MGENAGEIVIERLREALRNPVLKKRLVDQIRARSWPHWTYKQGSARVNQWLEPDDPHEFPARFLDIAIRVVGDAGCLDPLLALESKLRREQRLAARNVEPEVERKRA